MRIWINALWLGAGLAIAAPASAARDAANPAAQHALVHTVTHAAQLHAGPDDAFSLRDAIVDADGSEHARFDRSYKGPVSYTHLTLPTKRIV